MEFKRNRLALQILLICICTLLIHACGGGAQSESKQQSGTGSLAVRVNWPDELDSATGSSSSMHAASVDCQNISTVEVQVYGPPPGHTLVVSGGPWECELGEGQIEKIPATNGYTVVMVARNTEGQIEYRGSQDAVNVVAGQTTAVEIAAASFRPQDPSPENGTELNSIDLDWAPVEGASGYEIRISANEDLSDSTSYQAQTPPFSPPGLSSSTTYHWQVVALDTFGNVGAGSEIRNFRLALGVPTPTLPDEGFIVTASEVDCEWSEIADSTYHLYIATDSDMTNLVVDSPVATNSYTFADLTQDVAYYWQVCAVNDKGPGNRSAIRTFFTFSGPELETPAQDHVLPKENVQLGWSAFSADDSLRYEAIISRSADMNDMGSRVVKYETTDTYYTPEVGLLKDNQTYYWRVIALVKNNTDGLPSPVRSFKTLGKPEAHTPTDAVTAYKPPFNFTWQSVNNGNGYRIVISQNSDLGGPAKNSVVSNPTYTVGVGDKDLKYGLRYYWRVYALDSNGDQHDAYSTTIRTFDLFGVPTLTSPPHQSSQPNGGFSFQWQAVPGAAKYHLLVREYGGEYTNPVIDQVVTTTSFALARYSLSSAVRHYWKVFAIDGSQNEGADSAEFYFTTHDAMRITDINPYPLTSVETADAFKTTTMPYLTAFKNHLYFRAFDGKEYGLWMTDGSPEGTKRVGDFAYPHHLHVGVNGLFFVAQESIYDSRNALWLITDPSSSVAIVVPPGPTPYDYGFSIAFVHNKSNHRLFYSVLSESEDKYKIWMVQYGSPMRVLKAGFADSITKKYSNPIELANTSGGGGLFFQTWNTSSDVDLWCSPYDYRTATKLTTSSGPHGYIGKVGVINQKFIFSAKDQNSTTHLWTSDATPAGTTILVSNITGIGTNVIKGGYLYFWAKDPSKGHDYYHLWKTNGTAANTKPVTSSSGARIRAGGRYNGPPKIATLDNQLYFRWRNDSVGDELYRSDGTYDGTTLIRDIHTTGDSGYYGSTYDFIETIGDNVYFRADRTSNGSVDVGQLWATDGDEAAAVVLCDPYPCYGSYNNLPGMPVGLNGDIFFPAKGDKYGRELWRHTP